jgi:hypothetical protein
MANENTASAAEDFNTAAEKPSLLKTAFQYAGAFVSTISCEPPQMGFNAAGYAYDYCKARIQLALSKPQL